MINKIKKLLLSSTFILLLAFLLGCTQNIIKSITIGPSNLSTIAGNDAGLVVVFSDYTSFPETLNVYSENQDEPLASNIAVTEGTLLLPTSSLSEGAYKIFVKDDEIESNHITLSVLSKPAQNQKIVISPAVSGDAEKPLSVVIAFSNYETEPKSIDIYIDGKTEVFKKDVAIVNNSFTLETKDLKEKTFNIYVKAGDIQSNKCTVTLSSDEAEKKEKKITISGPKKYSFINNADMNFSCTLENIEGYTYYRCPSITVYMDGKEFKNITLNKTSFTVGKTGISEGKHSFYVKLNNSTSEIQSNTIEVEITNSVFATEITKIESVYTNTADINWEFNGIYGFEIFCSTTDDISTASVICSGSGSSCNYTYDFNGKSEGTYYFWVKMQYTSGGVTQEALSKSYKYDYKKQIPTAPDNITVTKAAGARNNIHITWNDTKAYHYQILYSENKNDQNPKSLTSIYRYNKDGSDVQLNAPTGTYYFWIKPYTVTYIENNPVSTKEVMYSHTYTAPAIPENFAIQSTSDNAVTLNWNNGDSDYYWIYFNTEDNPETAIKYSSIDRYKSRIIYLQAAATYYFWVKAADNYSNEQLTSGFTPSTTYTLASYDNHSLAKPTNLNVAKNNSYSIKVSCDTNGATYYRVFYSKKNDPATAIDAGYTTSGSIYTNLYIQDFEKGTKYYFWVKATDSRTISGNHSDFSDVFDFTPNPSE